MAIVTPFVRSEIYPDKEFRYLRTVIVTAAVYWLRSDALTSSINFLPLVIPRAGVYISIRPLSC